MRPPNKICGLINLFRGFVGGLRPHDAIDRLNLEVIRAQFGQEAGLVLVPRTFVRPVLTFKIPSSRCIWCELEKVNCRHGTRLKDHYFLPDSILLVLIAILRQFLLKIT